MKTLGIIVAILAVVVIGAVAAYKLAYPTYSHRYRLTLEVVTPDGLKKGSSVIEPRTRTEPQILPNTGSVPGLRGEAVFVDLGHGKNVVGLLGLGDKAQNVDGIVRLAFKVFGRARCTGAYCQWKQMANMSGERDLPVELTPTLVTVADVNDPNSVRIIRRGSFEEVFGAGYRFKRASIELTKDPVTEGIERKLPFLKKPSDLTTLRVERGDQPYMPQLSQFRVGGN